MAKNMMQIRDGAEELAQRAEDSSGMSEIY
jgi:hypothetical protein